MEYTDRRGNTKTPNDKSVFGTRKGAFAILKNKDKILMARAEYAMDVNELPGGGIDEGENIEQALVRELQEETGFTIENQDKLDNFHQEIGFFAEFEKPDGSFWKYDMNFYLIDASSLDYTHFNGIKLNPEGGEIEWIAIDNLKNIQLMATHKKAISSLLKIEL